MFLDLPVVVIGAGPVGLAAAAHLLERDQSVVLLEAGPAAGHNIRDWGHVRLFSPWKYLVDPAALRRLEPTGWTLPPPDALPTGSELVSAYLEPLAAQLQAHLHTDHRVLSVTRLGHDRMKDGRRSEVPFAVLADTPEGRRRFLARAVIDATGTWANPNPMGSEGVPAAGETEARESVHYGLPNIAGTPERYAGKRVLVIGSGHSAINNVLSLAELPGTRIAWGVRRANPAQLWGGGDVDELPARGALGRRIKAAIDGGRVHLLRSLSIGSLVRNEHGLDVVDVDGVPRCNVDEIIVATGSRPNRAMTRELRLEFDLPTEAVKALGPIIDPNHHSCGSVPPHGVVELSHPGEPGFYMVGMKSYGRAPTFLMMTGYEQVRSVAAELAGDLVSARSVELVLPQTGVCSVDGEASSGCC